MQLAPLALLAGILSMTAPCCLPIIPGYLSYISGVSSGSDKKRVLGTASLFVLGFGLVFTAWGATASLIGKLVLGALPVLLKVSGVFVFVMGLAMLGIVKIPFLYNEKRFDMRKIKPGPGGAFPLGMAFAFGWTPCIGPVLGGILTAAAATQTAWKGAALLAVYSLGMGIPFLGLAYASGVGPVATFFRRKALVIEKAGGGLLIVMGLLLVSGFWNRLFDPLVRIFSRAHWPPI